MFGEGEKRRENSTLAAYYVYARTGGAIWHQANNVQILNSNFFLVYYKQGAQQKAAATGRCLFTVQTEWGKQV